jgi:AmmeMemoRadiSam system protein A
MRRGDDLAPALWRSAINLPEHGRALPAISNPRARQLTRDRMTLAADDRRVLRTAAHSSIAFGLAHQCVMAISLPDYPERLHAERATFVTLRHAEELLGCIGTLRPHRPLVADVVHNAYHAAFSDPRFAPLDAVRLPGLEVHISILSRLEPMEVHSEADLLARLRPGFDGLVLEEGDRSATFLPAMWPRLPTPRSFVRVLKEKAGLPAGYWSTTIRAYRYTAEEA